MTDPRRYVRDNLPRFQEELFEFLRIPSISAQREYHGDIRRTAEWLAARMRELGLEAATHATRGNPVVLGRWMGAGADAPTVLVYGHYDVQPVEPIEEWGAPPFEPELRDGRVYARGATDDKGQIYAHLKAIETHMQTVGRLPVNVVVLVEGEEEVGSPNLMEFVQANAELLRADAVVISDSAMLAPGVPTICTSTRGFASFEITVHGPDRDLHSGQYGGAVLNPATVLSRLIGSLHDEHWKVAIAGFYDDVDAPGEESRRIDELPFDEAAFRAETGAPSLAGEAGYSTLERLWLRPTVEVNGLIAGHTGEGPRTVLPSRATAKVSCRLVPHQKPARIETLFRRHLENLMPAGMRLSITAYPGCVPWRVTLDGSIYRAAARALETVFGRQPVHAGSGGSLPILPQFQETLGAPVLLIGFGSPGENAHAPDEWMSIANFESGIRVGAALLSEFAADSDKARSGTVKLSRNRRETRDP